MQYVYLTYRSTRVVGAAEKAVVAVKGTMDFQHKNIKGRLETRMNLIFS
jgi:hypothetical protein